MKKDDIIIVGSGASSLLHAKILLEASKHNVGVVFVDQKDVNASEFKREPILYPAPIEIETYFTPPLTRAERRKQQRKHKI